MAATVPFHLIVMTGPNAGAALSLPAGRVTMGGASGDGVMLDGIAPAAMTLTLDGNRVRMKSGDDQVAIGHAANDLTDLPAGQAKILSLPAMMRLGDDSLIALARNAPDRRTLLSLRSATIAACIALSGGLLIGLQMPADMKLPGMQALANAPAQSLAIAPATPAPAQANLHATSPRTAICSENCAATAAPLLKSRIEVAGLTGLSLTDHDGVLRITGYLPPAQAGLWADLRRQFETDFGSAVPLLVDVSADHAMPGLAVASIWLGKRPELRTRSGDVLRIGDQTRDGWTVRRIVRGEITLRRDGRDVKVNF